MRAVSGAPEAWRVACVLGGRVAALKAKLGWVMERVICAANEEDSRQASAASVLLDRTIVVFVYKRRLEESEACG